MSIDHGPLTASRKNLLCSAFFAPAKPRASAAFQFPIFVAFIPTGCCPRQFGSESEGLDGALGISSHGCAAANAIKYLTKEPTNMTDESILPMDEQPQDPLAVATADELVVSLIEDEFDLELLFDGGLRPKSSPIFADSPQTLQKYLSVAERSHREVFDDILGIVHTRGYEHKASELAPALRRYCRRKEHERFNTVMTPLLMPEAQIDQLRCEAEWEKLGTLFDAPAHLSVHIFKHFIWLVKQKATGRTGKDHLMPILFSSVQGSGKTTFVRKFLGPLRELASADTLLSDFADRRSGTIYRYPVVVIDDMEQLPKAAVPALKSLITAERINRRQIMTSQNSTVRQRATLIGTANAPVQELIDDHSGYRRFVTLPFRNGDEDKGGDRAIWHTVSSLDYELLWLSVETFKPSPIITVRQELLAFQNSARPISALLRWLRELDLGCREVRAITTRWGVRADGLHELYLQTGVSISRQKFAEEMLWHFSDPSTPFGAKRKVEIGAVYCVKEGWSQPIAEAPNVPPIVPLSDPSASSAPSGPSGSSASQHHIVASQAAGELAGLS